MGRVTHEMYCSTGWVVRSRYSQIRAENKQSSRSRYSQIRAENKHTSVVIANLQLKSPLRIDKTECALGDVAFKSFLKAGNMIFACTSACISAYRYLHYRHYKLVHSGL